MGINCIVDVYDNHMKEFSSISDEYIIFRTYCYIEFICYELKVPCTVHTFIMLGGISGDLAVQSWRIYSNKMGDFHSFPVFQRTVFLYIPYYKSQLLWPNF